MFLHVEGLFPARRAGTGSQLAAARQAWAAYRAAAPRALEARADSWFFDRAKDLSDVSPALMKLTITSHQPNALPAGTIALTPEGRGVLQGEADRVKLCGIDRWLGGVHVHGRGRAWRWSDRAGHLVHA